MASEKHIDILRQGIAVWNQWRIDNPSLKPKLMGETLSHLDLSGADLSGAELFETRMYGVNLQKANLSKANLREAILSEVNFSEADLRDADLSSADLTDSDLIGANLIQADLYVANLSGTDLSHADLTGADLYGVRLIGANLTHATLVNVNLSRANLTQANLVNANLEGAGLTEAVLVDTDFSGANLSGCRIYGISAWNVNFEGATQKNLIITKPKEAVVTVDELEVAQFVYLVLNNRKLRAVIDTITTKSVLILGRFTAERKAVLEAIRDALRQSDCVPILFDFEKPSSRDLTETVFTLASMSHFVIADLSDPNSIPQELMAFGQSLLSVPISPLFCPTTAHPEPYPMFEDHFMRYPHVLPIYRYNTVDELIANLLTDVINPAKERAKKMRPGK